MEATSKSMEAFWRGVASDVTTIALGSFDGAFMTFLGLSESRTTRAFLLFLGGRAADDSVLIFILFLSRLSKDIFELLPVRVVAATQYALLRNKQIDTIPNYDKRYPNTQGQENTYIL